MTEEDKKIQSGEIKNPENKMPIDKITGKEGGRSLDHDNLGDEPEILKDMPSHVKESLVAIASMRADDPLLSSFASKINENHIDKLIDSHENGQERIFKDNQQSRKFQLLYVLIAVMVFIFLAIFLVGKDTELFKEIIKLFIAFVGGIGTGFGIKNYMNRSS